MRIRRIEGRDEERIRSMHLADADKYVLPELNSGLVEERLLIEDDAGEILAAAFAVRVPEIVLVMGKGHPLTKLRALGLIHAAMRERLRARGYETAFAVVSDRLKAYARHMVRKFGWTKDYTAYRIS